VDIFGVETLETVGAGVTEVRLVDGAGASGGTLSVARANALVESATLECAAVARIAFMRSILFCCRFEVPEVVACTFVVDSAEMSCVVREVIPSCLLLLSSDIEGSTIGQTKPVRGV